MHPETDSLFTVLCRSENRLECETSNGKHLGGILVIGLFFLTSLLVFPFFGIAVGLAGLYMIGRSVRWTFDRAAGTVKRTVSLFSSPISTRRYSIEEFKGMRIRKAWSGGEAGGPYYAFELLRERSRVAVTSRPTLPLIQAIVDDVRKYLPQDLPLEVESSPLRELKRFIWPKKGWSKRISKKEIM